MMGVSQLRGRAIGRGRLACHHDGMMTLDVTSWRYFLCVVAAFNIVAWALSARLLNRRFPVMPAELYRTRRLQLLLSAVYVFGCAFRSAFPVYDVPRICLFNHWLSSVIVGRSVATVAELCFVGQWALMLNEISRAAKSALGTMVSLAVVPLIAVAEACSWYSVLTTSTLGHVAEEAFWGLSGALLVLSGVRIYPRATATGGPWCAPCSASLVHWKRSPAALFRTLASFPLAKRVVFASCVAGETQVQQVPRRPRPTWVPTPARRSDGIHRARVRQYPGRRPRSSRPD